jgi:hypothetical protein
MRSVIEISSKRRRRLAEVLLVGSCASIFPACGNQGSNEGGSAEQALPGEQQPASQEPEFSRFVAKLSNDERRQFDQFLTGVRCGESWCSVQDMAFPDRETLAGYFIEQVLQKRDKGLVVADSRKWLGTISVCWTDDSDATTADKAAVIAAVDETWATYANIAFDWYSSGTSPHVCDSTQAASFNVKIWQHSSQTRGCSAVGMNTRSGISCDGSVAHPFANMLLDVANTNTNKIVAVHEFGHAIGIYHEQDRVDSTCTQGEEPLRSGARHVGDYDPLSIMNYCAPKPFPYLSSGDVVAAAFIYDGKPISPTFRARSWLPTDLTYTATPATGGTPKVVAQTSVSNIAANRAFGAAKTADTVVVTASEARLRCSIVGTPPNVSDDVADVLYSTPNTIPVECYDPANVTAAVL